MKIAKIFMILFVLTLKANAQILNETFFMKATIITKTDTIKCFAEHKDEYEGRVKYKLGINDKKQLKIDAEKIEHIYFQADKFDRIKLKDESILMKQICVGKISLYKHVYKVKTGAANDWSVYTGGASFENTDFYLLKNNIVTELRRTDLHKTLKELMSDNADIQSEIDKLKYNESKFEIELKDLVSEYNLLNSI
jgi:hypothetical protein